MLGNKPATDVVLYIFSSGQDAAPAISHLAMPHTKELAFQLQDQPRAKSRSVRYRVPILSIRPGLMRRTACLSAGGSNRSATCQAANNATTLPYVS